MSLFTTTDKNLFINKLHEITSVNPLILTNLIELNLIHSLLEDKNSIIIQDNHFSFSNIQFKQDYQQQLEFIFAAYPLHNKKISEILYDDERDILKRIMIDNTSELKSIISLNEYNGLSFAIMSDYQSFTNYDISLLNSEELIHFRNLIKLESMKNLEFIPITSHRYFKELFLTFNPLAILKSFEDIDQHIEKGTKRYLDFIQEIKINAQNEIEVIFERALLEQKIMVF